MNKNSRENLKTSENVSPVASSAPEAGKPRRAASRRALIKGGLASAPIIFTLANRPAFAKACTGSANASMLVGTSIRGPDACGGRSVETLRSLYPADMPGESFAGVFGPRWKDAQGALWEEDYTIYQALHLSAQDDFDGFAAVAAAAYINADSNRAGMNPYAMTTTDVTEMVGPVLADQLYIPRNSSTPWDRGMVKRFLISTFDS